MSHWQWPRYRVTTASLICITFSHALVGVTEASRFEIVTNSLLTVKPISKLYIVAKWMYVFRFLPVPRPLCVRWHLPDPDIVWPAILHIDNRRSDITYILYWMQVNLCGFMSACCDFVYRLRFEFAGESNKWYGLLRWPLYIRELEINDMRWSGHELRILSSE